MSQNTEKLANIVEKFRIYENLNIGDASTWLVLYRMIQEHADDETVGRIADSLERVLGHIEKR